MDYSVMAQIARFHTFLEVGIMAAKNAGLEMKNPKMQKNRCYE